MNRLYQKSTAEFYTFLVLVVLSITTLILDHKYNQISQIRSAINDLIENHKLYAGLISIIVALITNNILATISVGMASYLFMSNFMNI